MSSSSALRRGLYSLQVMTAADELYALLCILIRLCACCTGFSQMSKLRKLRHLSLAQSFEGCTHYGLDAALATMIGTKTTMLMVVE